VPRAPRMVAQAILLAKRSHAWRHIGALRTLSTARIARGKCGRMWRCGVFESHNPPRLSLKAGHIPTSHQRSHGQHPMGVLRTPRHVVSSGSCVIKRTCHVSQQIRSREGSSELRSSRIYVFDRGESGEYQVTARHSLARISGLVMCLSSSSCLSGCSKPDLLFGWLVKARRLASKPAGQNRVCKSRLGSN
jgi:hypothetical protein